MIHTLDEEPEAHHPPSCMSDPLAFSIPQTFPPFTMRDYSKSKFDYHRDKSGGWRFIAVPRNVSLNQQKLIPREQT
jgi:hypothetical protein